ncbi:MAG: biosynthetic-type acetolactate synthase large subunit, partial [Bacteroidales bacterium]
MTNKHKIIGSEILIRSLMNENVDTIFGYPGGAVIPIFDKLYDFTEEINHVLVRHEQGAAHAAEGYARVSGKTGVVLVTSGPGATNIVTGVADAMIDSTPMVVITGQIASTLIGTDAFQEVDIVGITQPITKWSYQIRNVEDISWAIARAFYIASTGRPGPVVLDITKDAQLGSGIFNYEKCDFIRSYNPYPAPGVQKLDEAASLINAAKKPLLLIGQGVTLSNAEKELAAFIEKTGIPAAWTLLGASALPTNHPLNKGMLGMHGNIGPNIKTNECDLLIAIGMRFDDRVTGDLNTYAKQAKIIHIDIDHSEIDKNVITDVAIISDARMALIELTSRVNETDHKEWVDSFREHESIEFDAVIKNEVYPVSGHLNMGEVVKRISSATGNKAVLVTDVGQNQMISSRYFEFTQNRSMVTSGGLGTMGYGLPAAIGAKLGAPERTICLFVGDGGIQMNIQELGTIMQYGIGVKIIVLNNEYLGMVRQWQELFFNKRYSHTPMYNPDYVQIAKAYGVSSSAVSDRSELDNAISEMLKDNRPYLLVVNVEKKGMVYPMVPAGATITNIMLG